jgi:hypothetical protein
MAINTIFSDAFPPFTDSSKGPYSTSSYSFETLGELKAQLANRLNDPSMIYWTDAELTSILSETLRTFSFFTWYWRDQAGFNTTPGVSFYDLTAQLPSDLDQTVTDRDLITDIEYHFQEPPTTIWPAGWTGTAMFTLDDLSHALQKRRNKFLAETGVFITRTVQSSGVPTGGRIGLQDTVIDIRRLARTNTGIIINLWRVDENELTAFDSTWSAAAAQDPAYFSVLSSQPLVVQLAPAPSAAATIDLLTINTGTDFTPTASNTIIGIPDDMSWIIKWGAMADLLQKDSPSQDKARADYCEKRYQHGVQLCHMAAVITAARINTTPIHLCPVAELDAYAPGWQSATPATPDILATAGLNLVALYPPPAILNLITLDIIKDAPIPSSDSDFVQIGREYISTLLDYAVHLAMFKVAGDEWEATSQLLDQFMSMVSNYNARMNAASKIWNELRNVTNAEEPTRLRMRELKKEQK